MSVHRFSIIAPNRWSSNRKMVCRWRLVQCSRCTSSWTTRQGTGSTLITSQFPVDQWHEVINDATVADAILHRLVHNACGRRPGHSQRGPRRTTCDANCTSADRLRSALPHLGTAWSARLENDQSLTFAQKTRPLRLRKTDTKKGEKLDPFRTPS